MPGTFIALVLGSVLVLTAMLFHIDLVKLNLKLLNFIENHQVDDLLSALILLAMGLLLDVVLWRRRHRAQMEAGRLKTLQATMRTVLDIVNNFLNNLLLFEMEFKHVIPAESLDELDELIQETHRKLKALGNVEVVPDSQLRAN